MYMYIGTYVYVIPRLILAPTITTIVSNDNAACKNTSDVCDVKCKQWHVASDL